MQEQNKRPTQAAHENFFIWHDDTSTINSDVSPSLGRPASGEEDSTVSTKQIDTPLNRYRYDDNARNKENVPLQRLVRIEEAQIEQRTHDEFKQPLSVLELQNVSMSRTRSAPSFQHARKRSTQQDIAFLGPTVYDLDDVKAQNSLQSKELTALKDQLSIALENLRLVTSEVRELRKLVSDHSSVVKSDAVEENDYAAQLRDFPDPTTLKLLESSPEPLRNDDSVGNTKTSRCDATDPPRFPTLQDTQHFASQLPLPDEPGISSAYMRGSFIFNDQPLPGFTQMPNTPWNQRVSDVETTTEQNEEAPQRWRGMSLAQSAARNDKLSFFPKTSEILDTSRQSRDSSTWISRDVSTYQPSVSDRNGDAQSSIDHADTYHKAYTKTMDRRTDMNWRHMLERIVCESDQQASIALQQRLKVASTEQKMAIIDAVIIDPYPLMINRFGNFLIQRCFEHGTHSQISAIASAIIGHVRVLSMDAFGCHVIQKALDNVDDHFKSNVVDELLQDITGTITHKYACHVWQKIFETRWADTAPQIMSAINRELHGQWEIIACGETGSLVVQNIFENCVEAERRPCIQELLSKIPAIIRGQWGNWVVQHIISQGAPEDRAHTLNIMFANAVDYSTDQYASKVIEKALKTGEPAIMQRYLIAITNTTELNCGRARIPLIDIATDQYGNYLIQYMLQFGNLEQRTTVIDHIRKHMVSMRGSRYGAKVAFLVERMRHEPGENRGARSYRPSNSRQANNIEDNSGPWRNGLHSSRI